MENGTLSGWGRIAAPGRELITERLEGATRGAVLTRGLGRSYGDSSLPAEAGDRVVGSRLADRILSFEPKSGMLRAEAGLSLLALNRLFLPRSLVSPVMPGTQFVTLGGMVASDVHGKNHHRAGCFGAHVAALKIRLADGDIVRCSPTQDPDLFHGCIGGMGLLGHILEVEFPLERIPSRWIAMERVMARNIDEFLAALERAAASSPMSMGWIDCLSRGASMGRGVMMAGRWAEPEELPAAVSHSGLTLEPKGKVPFEFPNWVLNPWTAKLFNAAYNALHGLGKARSFVQPRPFFFPLDVVEDWNLGYGARGFTQYQCVLPKREGAGAVRKFLELLTSLGGASPLCVIKDCGPEGRGVLSFPMEGTSIAVDMAVGAETQKIIDKLNDYVIGVGGRIYLTKDRFTRPEHFRAMERRLPAFQALREKWDPNRRLRSAQSRRLFGD